MKVSRALATDGPCSFCTDLVADIIVQGNEYGMTIRFCWNCLHELNKSVRGRFDGLVIEKPWALGGKG